MFEDSDLIASYSRAEALEDGTLINITERARELGYRWPIAMTRTVWEDCVAWSDEDTKRKGWPQDEDGRLHDVLWMCLCGLRRAKPGDRVLRFSLVRVPRKGRGTSARRVDLILECGPGDDGEPVMTIMTDLDR